MRPGVEYAGELHDFLVHDLQSWYPDIAGKLKITLVEGAHACCRPDIELIGPQLCLKCCPCSLSS